MPVGVGRTVRSFKTGRSWSKETLTKEIPGAILPLMPQKLKIFIAACATLFVPFFAAADLQPNVQGKKVKANWIALLETHEDKCSITDTLPPNELAPAQGDVGACHDFTTVANLSSALNRLKKHEKKTAGGPSTPNEMESLSEADLFVQKTLNSPQFFEKLSKIALLRPVYPEDFPSVEGGVAFADCQFALAHGVAHQQTDAYEAIMLPASPKGKSRYEQYREKMALAINVAFQNIRARLRASHPGDCPSYEYTKYSPCLQKFIEEYHNTGVAKTVVTTKVYKAFLSDNSKYWSDYAKQKTEETASDNRELALLARGDAELMRTIINDRLQVNNLLSGATPIQYEENLANTSVAHWIIEQLDHDRPVTLDINLARLAAKRGPKAHIPAGLHSILVKGYRINKDGELSFDIRNTWKVDTIKTLNEEELESRFAPPWTLTLKTDQPDHCRKKKSRGSQAPPKPRP